MVDLYEYTHIFFILNQNRCIQIYQLSFIFANQVTKKMLIIITTKPHAFLNWIITLLVAYITLFQAYWLVNDLKHLATKWPEMCCCDILSI